MCNGQIPIFNDHLIHNHNVYVWWVNPIFQLKLIKSTLLKIMDGWLAHGLETSPLLLRFLQLHILQVPVEVGLCLRDLMNFSVDFDGSDMIWLCLRRDMDAAAHCVLKNASCKHGYWSLLENQGDIRCIDFVKIGFFSKWISKNDKALSTRQISPLIALQHLCIQGCEIAAIAQVFFLGQNITCIASERLWASIGLFELGNPNPVAGSDFPDYNCNHHMYPVLDPLVAFSVVTVTSGECGLCLDT